MKNKNNILYVILKWLGYFATGIAVLSLLFILIYVFSSGLTKLNFHVLFGKYTEENPTLPSAIVGTLILVGIAPLGIGTAIFLVEYNKKGNKIVKIIRIAIETLAGIPSIVYGLFGYLMFVVSLGLGYSLLGGALTLSIMILPVIVRSTEESLLAVQDSYREGSYALGAGKARTIFKIVLPAASSGIVSSLILAMGRVVSESAVLILTTGMVANKLPKSILSPGTSLALDVYYFGSFGHPNEAAAAAVVLIALILFLNLTATIVGRLLKKKMGE